MKSEQELRSLRDRLSKWRRKQGRKPDWERGSDLWFEDKKLGLKILEDYAHAGVSEWIEALRWVLSIKKEDA